MKKPALTDVSPTCERCRHWRELTDPGDDERSGECWRYPQIVLMGIDGNLVRTRPPADPEEICGEFGAGQ